MNAQIWSRESTNLHDTIQFTDCHHVGRCQSIVSTTSKSCAYSSESPAIKQIGKETNSTATKTHLTEEV